jgi:hypothetical protein
MNKDVIISKLQSMPEGLLPSAVANQVVDYMIGNWGRLGGKVDHSKTYAYKLRRAENVTLTHPATICFVIERHGGTVRGSIYAALHGWTVDLLNETAFYGENDRGRLLYQRDPPLNVVPLAHTIAKKILSQDTQAKELKWKNPNDVRILPNTVIQPTNKQTTTARRKRLQGTLRDLLIPHGWVEISPNRYQHP